jgi:hypothetical protein
MESTGTRQGKPQCFTPKKWRLAMPLSRGPATARLDNGKKNGWTSQPFAMEEKRSGYQNE